MSSMKRKVNLVGQNTLTVSLPSFWVKKHKVKKGDEIEIGEEDNKLIISKENFTHSKEDKHVTIDISNFKRLASPLIGAAYLSGYNNITVKYATAEELKVIQNKIERGYITFDITEYGKNEIKASVVSNIEGDQFENMFKRMIFTFKDIMNECKYSIIAKDFERIKSVALRDIAIDKYGDICGRLLNKNIK